MFAIKIFVLIFMFIVVMAAGVCTLDWSFRITDKYEKSKPLGGPVFLKSVTVFLFCVPCVATVFIIAFIEIMNSFDPYSGPKESWISWKGIGISIFFGLGIYVGYLENRIYIHDAIREFRGST